MTKTAGAPDTRTNLFKVLGASLVGTTIEWYDFALYGFMAATVFPLVFFPGLPPGQGVLSSLATLAIAAITRPIGAIIFGGIGDTIGRKRALVASMILMTVSTTAIGLLPSFSRAGWLAVVLLFVLRITQSIAVGGEWGGAVTYAVEAAPKRWRALFGSFPQIGNSIGLFLATGLTALVASFGDQAWFTDFGWRIPFFMAGAFGIIGIWLRLVIDETETFEQAHTADTKKNAPASRPVADLFRNHGGLVFRVAGACLITIGGYYISINYMAAYATTHVGMDAVVVAEITNLVSILIVGIVIISGVIGSVVGVRKFTLLGMFLHLVAAFPMFWLMSQGGFWGIFWAMMLGQIAGAMAYATTGTMVSGWFPTEVRQSGLSLGYQIAGVIGSFTLLAAQALEIAYGNWVPVAVLFFVIALVSWLSALTFNKPIHLEGTESVRSPKTGEAKVGIEGDTLREMPAMVTEAEVTPGNNEQVATGTEPRDPNA